jgi:cellulose synthase/poly-beta-1,6-N-acetylglucosamine synthase-like glycosyltransferase
LLGKFNLYDLYILSFVQLVLSFVLVLSPVRDIGIRFRWTGSRITEVMVGSVGAVAISAVACVLTQVLWGVQIGGLETAAYLLVIVSIVVIALQPERNVIGHVFYASFGSASLIFIVWASYVAIAATHSILEMVTASLVILLDLAAFVVWMSNINYQSDVLCRSRKGRPMPKADPSYQPFVSIHVPAYNEPPELLIETIKAAEAIDYPNFEVIVMDNNTKDPAVWGPVEEYCRDRPRVKFVHVAPWPGYKAGACNLALRRYTDPRAEVIGLIDADDLVQPHYLRETAPYFSDPTLGFVQTFEGNRDFEGSPYYTACVDSFQAFYLSVMSSRNERNTVPFVGTMGLFRRSALEAAGGWNEWCICEDTEASLRVTKAGWSGLYVPRCFGRGVVPPSWAGMLTQRHRWCFGAMQIMRLHWRSLMPWDRSPDNHMTAAQRRDYLMASVGWFRDLLMLTFSLLLLVITGLLVTHSGFIVAPMDGSRSVLPLSLIVIATLCMMWTQRHWTTLSFRRALLSTVISLAVAWIIALGCIEGVARRDGVFLRTAKSGGRRTIFTALRLARVETVLSAALFICVAALATVRHRPWVLMFLIFVQAVVYFCGPVASIWNLRAHTTPREEFRSGFAGRELTTGRRKRAWVRFPRPAAAALTALCVGGAASAFVAPVALLHTTTPAQGALSPKLLLASPGTTVYLQLGSTASAASRTYYPVTPVRLSGLPSSPRKPAPATFSFTTSSLALLGEIMQAAASGGRISRVSLAFRAPIPGGQAATELVDTFTAGTISALSEHLSGTLAGSVSLTLPVASSTTSSPAALQHAGPFAAAGGRSSTQAKAYVSTGSGEPFYAVTGVRLSQTTSRAPVDLSLTTSAQPLLQQIFDAGGAASGIGVLTLSVRAGAGGRLEHTFAGLSVGSVKENLPDSVSGTATLVVRSP